MTVAVSTALLLTLGIAENDPPRSFLLGMSSIVATAATACDKPALNRAITHYRHAYGAARAKMHATGPVARVWYRNCVTLRHRAQQWRERAQVARWLADAWTDWHYNWRDWLPTNWWQLGTCETGYGGDPNFNHANSRFVSAFGISWREYNADAAHMGAPPWHIRHTPRDQYDAARGHLARFGDGWTCPGP